MRQTVYRLPHANVLCAAATLAVAAAAFAAAFAAAAAASAATLLCLVRAQNALNA